MSMTVLPKPTVFVETREIGNGEFEMAWYVLIISMAKLTGIGKDSAHALPGRIGSRRRRNTQQFIDVKCIHRRHIFRSQKFSLPKGMMDAISLLLDISLEINKES